MRYAYQTNSASGFGTLAMKAMLPLVIVGALVATTRGGELCARTDGSAARDQATGSIVMAGAAVVGFSSTRTVTFITDPTACGLFPGESGPFPDCDDDGLVTLADMHCLYECLTGPDVTVSRECIAFDLDGSETVDLKDVARFQRLFGSGIGGM